MLRPFGNAKLQSPWFEPSGFDFESMHIHIKEAKGICGLTSDHPCRRSR